jgi:hypothetical protein
MGKAMRLVLLVLVSLSVAGCQTVEQRAEKAAEKQGQAQAWSLPPSMPAACTAHVERVFPKLGEKVRWTQERWQITADNRDRRADDCAAWDRDRMAGKVVKPN